MVQNDAELGQRILLNGIDWRIGSAGRTGTMARSNWPEILKNEEIQFS